MHEGEIVQEGTPQDVYLRPNSRVVAEFLGFATEITAVTESVHFAPDDRSRVLLRVRGNGWDGHCFGSSSVKAGDPVTLTVRPDAFELAAGSQSEHATSERAGLAWTGTVRSSLFLGSRRRLSVAVGNVLLRVETRPEHAGVAVGSQVTLWAPAERVWAIVESASSPA
jgi:ABC-type Fe3+/spermidine/putrescine transport system ATPase subunit